mgnify:CR=1 FL=1
MRLIKAPIFKKYKAVKWFKDVLTTFLREFIFFREKIDFFKCIKKIYSRFVVIRDQSTDRQTDQAEYLPLK